MRLIDADALKEQLFSYYGCINPDASKSNYKGETLMDYEIVDMIQDCFENSPTITPESLVRHGRWILDSDDEYASHHHCDRCPNCGAKMDLEE